MVRHTSAKQIKDDLLVARSLWNGDAVTDRRLNKILDLYETAMPKLRKILSFNPDIKVIIRPIRSSNDFDTYGRCGWDEWIEIDPRNIGPTKALECLCHELIHAQQVWNGDLSWSNNGAYLWKGKEVDLPYRKQPWEKEAYGNQRSVMEKCL